MYGAAACGRLGMVGVGPKWKYGSRLQGCVARFMVHVCRTFGVLTNRVAKNQVAKHCAKCTQYMYLGTYGSYLVGPRYGIGVCVS